MKCLCGCGTTAAVRGLCRAAYLRYYKLVASRKTSWNALIKEGKALHRNKNPYGGNKDMKKELIIPINIDEEL